jgi:hypothetical protein
MNTNYDLRKALYNFLDIKFNTNQITIAAGDKFKMVRVEAGSIVNLFVSTGTGGIYLNAFGENFINEYYSDIRIKVYWSDDIIYIQNYTSGNIVINSIYVEFLKGKLLETFMSPSSEDLSGAKITVNDSNAARVNFKDDTLTFKTEYNSLINSLNSFSDSFSDWKDTLGAFALVDKLIPANGVESTNNKRITSYIDPSSISNGLLINGTILREKLSSVDVTGSLDLADSAVQNITLNAGSNLKDVDKNVNINSLVMLKIQDVNNSVTKEYALNGSGEIIVDDWNEYIQPKLLGSTNDLIYFNGTNTIQNISKDIFLLKSDIASNFDNVDDSTIPSSLLVKTSLNLKVDNIDPPRDSLSSLSFIKLTINEQGQITNEEEVNQSDLTDIIQDYYLTTSYEWDPSEGVLKLL